MNYSAKSTVQTTIICMLTVWKAFLVKKS